MKHVSKEKVKPPEISLFERGMIYTGFVLGILNLVMGASYQIVGIYQELGIYRIDHGALIGTIFYALFVIYWFFWAIPFFASIIVNVYGCRKKQMLSVIGIILSLVGIFALMISRAFLSGQLPD